MLFLIILLVSVLVYRHEHDYQLISIGQNCIISAFLLEFF